MLLGRVREIRAADFSGGASASASFFLAREGVDSPSAPETRLVGTIWAAKENS
jgi:hypothetical protein